MIISLLEKTSADADKVISQESSPETETELNPEAIYTSRFMNFTNLPKPINSTKVQIEDSEGKNIFIYKL